MAGRKAKQLAISFASGPATGDHVIFYNRNTNETYPEDKTLNSSRQAIIDLSNFVTEPSVGDFIEIRLNGTKVSTTTYTVTSIPGKSEAIAVHTPLVGGISI